MSKLVKKVFGSGRKTPGAPQPGGSSEALTGIDPSRVPGMPTSAATGQGRRQRGGGSNIGGGRGALGANTVLSRTY